MNIKKILTATAAAAVLATTASAASADDWQHRHRDRDHDGRADNSWAERHDRDGYRDNYRYDRRMERRDYRRMISHERVYDVIRAHHYRYIGEPYWYRGVYGVRAYDPYGHIVFVRIDPYAGTWGGIYFRF